MDLARTLRVGRTERDMVDTALEGLPAEKQELLDAVKVVSKDIKFTGKSVTE